jgi:hypothetical protein
MRNALIYTSISNESTSLRMTLTEYNCVYDQ